MEGQASHPMEGQACNMDESLDLFPMVMDALSGTDDFSSYITSRMRLARFPAANTTNHPSEAGAAENESNDEGKQQQQQSPTPSPRGSLAGSGPHGSLTLRKFAYRAPPRDSLPVHYDGDNLPRTSTRAPYRSASVLTNASGGDDDDDDGQSHESTLKILVPRSYEVKEHYLESIFYISVSAILGSTARIFLGRIFGMDCELRATDDFMSRLSSKVCVTNGGRTAQTGGALFFDFPANVLGSFIMGAITPRLDEQRARLPWLRRDHPLQRDDVFYASLGVGFCGCLTTFASWNTQMVVMLDGTYCELGSQVVSALFGYALGILGPHGAFHFGRRIGLFMYNWKHAGEGELERLSLEEEIQKATLNADRRASTQQGVELVDDDEMVKIKPVPSHIHKIPLCLAAACLLVAFAIGAFKQDILFYKEMTLLWFTSPIGSLLRWRLTELNLRTDKSLCNQIPKWIPWGTLCANVLAATIGAVITGLIDRYYSSKDQFVWMNAVLFAISSGLAGSLSTVSTMIKETAILSEQYGGQAKSYFYVFGTCLCSMVIGLTVYAATVRIKS